MNTSQYMDKQIMDLSGSPPLTNNKDLLDLVNRHSHDDDDHDRDQHIAGGNGISKEEIMPSYDFQPIRPLVSSSLTSNLDGSSRPWSSADPRTVSSSAPLRMYDSVDTVEPTKVISDKDRKAIDAVVVAEIDRTMKKYTDTLLHVLEGVSARLTQLESRTHHMENSVDDLKVSVGNNQGSTEGKIRHLENILREVQTGVDVLKDKQDIVQAQLQIAKLQMSKVDPQSEHQKSGNIDSVQQTTPHQSHQLPPANLSHPPPSLPPPNAPHPPAQQNIAPHPPPQQNIAPPVHVPNQFPQNQFPSVPHSEPYFPPPGRTPEALDQQYQLPPNQQPHAPPPTSLPHQYQTPPQQQYSQPPQLPQHHTSLAPINHHPQLQSSLGHHSEESPYTPSQSYPPPSGPAPSQQSYGPPPPSHMYEPPANRTSSGFSTGYGPPSGRGEQYPYGGTPPPSQYGSASAMKPHQLPSPAVPQGGGSGYPQLPTARAVAQALPTASGSAGSGNRVPVDDVIDKVTTMGFPRDHVRATVRKLTENGQVVDLNTVLDKLMNDGEVQPQRGWPFAG